MNKQYFATVNDYHNYIKQVGNHILDKGVSYFYGIIEDNLSWQVTGDGITPIKSLPKYSTDPFDPSIFSKIEKPKGPYHLIEEKELIEILTGYYTFLALEAGGVDNWEWAGDSIRDFVQACIEEQNQYFNSIEDIAKDDIKRYPLA